MSTFKKKKKNLKEKLQKANLLYENVNKSLELEPKSKKEKNLFFKDHPTNTLASLQTQLKIHTPKASARLQTIALA